MQSSVTVCFLLLVFPINAHVKCKKLYLYNGHVPKWTPNDHVHICQKYKDSYHFATLYDTTNRIPVYSAYIVEDGKSSDHRWMVEPQLVNEKSEEANMMTEDSLKLDPKEIGMRQAINEDYNKRPGGYSRGHLNLNSHHAGDSRIATYTLTNIVPQNHELNQGLWSKHEAELKALAKDNSVYVLVGAIPSEGNWIKRDNEARVNIPDYMWVAYCYCGKKSCKSGGATAKNTENKIDKCTLSQLHDFLKKHKQIAGLLFDKNCYVE